MTIRGEAAQLYEITHLGTGRGPEVRTAEAGEVAAVIEYAGEHGRQVLVRPCRPAGNPGTKGEDAS